jgi:hypothetical protein
MVGEDKKRNTDPVMDGLVLILTTRNQIQMGMVKDALECEGIAVLLKSVMGYHSRGMLPFEQGFFDYRLLVSREYEARAREIVETIIPPEEIR